MKNCLDTNDKVNQLYAQLGFCDFQFIETSHQLEQLEKMRDEILKQIRKELYGNDKDLGTDQ